MSLGDFHTLKIVTTFDALCGADWNYQFAVV